MQALLIFLPVILFIISCSLTYSHLIYLLKMKLLENNTYTVKKKKITKKYIDISFISSLAGFCLDM